MIPPAIRAAPARREKAALLVIVLCGTALRLVRLDVLSFGSDEEITALAALALLEGWPPTLPGGLVYLRGLPFTFLESAMIAAAGVSEFSLRLVPVFAGGARIAAAWWLARLFLGPSSSLAAAALLAVAPFDVEISRVARMYSLFATLDLVFVAWLIRIADGARSWLGAAVCGSSAVAVHLLTMLHAPLALLGMIARGVSRESRLRLAAVGVLVVAAYYGAANEIFAAYVGSDAEGGTVAKIGPLQTHVKSLAAVVTTPGSALLGGLGVTAGAALTGVAIVRMKSWAGRLAALSSGVAFVGASPLLGAAAFLGALMLEGLPPARTSRPALLLATAGVAASSGWALAALLSADGIRASLESAARLLLGYPAPNWFEFVLATPAFLTLALLGVLVATHRAARASRPVTWLLLVAAALSPLLLSGMHHRTEALRFQIHSLAPLIVLALLAAESIAARIVKRPGFVPALAFLIVLATLLPQQTVRAVLREHGPVAEPLAFQNVAPDHRGAAFFVLERAAPDEWIAAEDSLQQHLYIGRTELWLRKFEDAVGFSVRDRATGGWREIYTGARLVGDLSELRTVAAEAGQHVVWLITSGEVEMFPGWYRTPETDATLRAWRPLAHFVGADGLTRVYRLLDGEPEPPSEAGRR